MSGLKAVGLTTKRSHTIFGKSHVVFISQKNMLLLLFLRIVKGIACGNSQFKSASSLIIEMKVYDYAKIRTLEQSPEARLFQRSWSSL